MTDKAEFNIKIEIMQRKEISNEFINELIETIQKYDDNFYMETVSINKVKSQLMKRGYSYKNILEIAYDLNMLARLITTIDDILLKLYVYSYIAKNEMECDVKQLKFESDFKKFYRIHNLSLYYPEIANKNNRELRGFRNDVTHDGSLPILRNPIKECHNDMYLDCWYPDKIIIEKNLELQKSLLCKAINDEDRIVKAKNGIEDIVLEVLDQYKVKYKNY